jgi:hypothetical protein
MHADFASEYLHIEWNIKLHYATSQKVTGLSPGEVIGFFY